MLDTWAFACVCVCRIVYTIFYIFNVNVNYNRYISIFIEYNIIILRPRCGYVRKRKPRQSCFFGLTYTIVSELHTVFQRGLYKFPCHVHFYFLFFNSYWSNWFVLNWLLYILIYYLLFILKILEIVKNIKNPVTK